MGLRCIYYKIHPAVIYQYNLSTGFQRKHSVHTIMSALVLLVRKRVAMGVVFNTDGTKMYMVGNSTDSVYQYTLSTGFDYEHCII